jgi:hypothetical protein
MEHGSCTVSGDAWLPRQLERRVLEMEELVRKGTEGEPVARLCWPWLLEGLFRTLQAQPGPRDVLLLCASRFVMLTAGGGENSLILDIVTVPAA